MTNRDTNNNIYLTINNKGPFQYEKGVSLEKVSKDFQTEVKYLIVAAIVDNELKELNHILNKDCSIVLVHVCTSIGSRIYQRSISFVFIRACMELFPGCRVSVEHSISKGLYCEVHYERPVNKEDVEKIQERMEEIISEDVILYKICITVDEAKEIFKSYGQINKVELLKYRDNPYINIYKCGWLKNYFYGYMVPSTGYLKSFKLQYFSSGVVIQYPRAEYNGEIPPFKEEPKLFKIFRESEKWGEILKIDHAASLNKLIAERKEEEFIRVAEALHEKKIAGIADQITNAINQKHLILIAGPSSSGKTTFAKRLSIQLKVNGLNPVSISLDDYFVNRVNTPRDENGDYNFESLYAIDLELFNENIEQILEGKEVEIPHYNFHTGKREYRGHKIHISKEQPVIIEGIHGLNDKLTERIPRENKFKIYISALTQLNIDEHNRIPTTDSRLIRRLVRDSKFRSNDANATLSLWDSVRRGEEENIFPFQEDADAMFNSVLFYELSVLKKYAVPLLNQIGSNNPHYPEAKRLLKFLDYFISLENEEEIPRTSILREFIGGSSFK